MDKFLEGLLKSIIQEFQERLYNDISKEIKGTIEKSKKILFFTGIAIFLVGIGFFLISWGIASIIDVMVGKSGLGFLIMGLFVALIGMILHSYAMAKK